MSPDEILRNGIDYGVTNQMIDKQLALRIVDRGYVKRGDIEIALDTLLVMCIMITINNTTRR